MKFKKKTWYVLSTSGSVENHFDETARSEESWTSDFNSMDLK